MSDMFAKFAPQLVVALPALAIGIAIFALRAGIRREMLTAALGVVVSGYLGALYFAEPGSDLPGARVYQRLVRQHDRDPDAALAMLIGGSGADAARKGSLNHSADAWNKANAEAE